MTQIDSMRQENEALRQRIATLNAAILRINASLDLDTVLSEIMESARTLTNACLGIIATVDEEGAPQDFVFSGLTQEEERELIAWPDHAQLFGHLHGLPGPLRLDNLSSYVQALGIKPVPAFSRAFQCMPMHHRGVNVGSFFLAEKADGEVFTEEDEETLKLFASQAALAIVNARTHGAAHRARVDFETLVETSPVGVVVFDVESGQPISLNREARRIGESLRMPGHTLEELLKVMTFCRSDGSEVCLSEFPVAEVLRDETIRAEEMVLSVPDGRSIRALVNATPIRIEGDAIVSVVVTFQDLTPLDEIERQRTEFLSLVGHELREPLAAIKGSATTLLEESEALDLAEMREFHRIITEQADHMRGLIGDLLDAGRIDAGTLSVTPEPSEVIELVERARNMFLSGGGRHGIVLDLPVELPRVMADRRRIVQVLNNLFMNAARQSEESAPVRVSAVHDEAHVTVSVTDKGRGVSPERLPQLFNKHVSGGPNAGHGLGLAICKGLVEAHGGRIQAESAGVGRGTTVTFTLPRDGAASPSLAVSMLPTAREKDERARILVVDDDPHTLRFARDALDAAGYAPLVTGEPQELARIVRKEKPRLVLLDVVLPGEDGIALMQQIPEFSDLPVIFISGYGRDEIIARALESGAADYIVKPFSPTELVARVRAALRRYEEPEPFMFGELAIDYDRRRVTVGSNTIALTATEYELLRMLSLNAGRVVAYNTLLNRLWNKRDNADTNLVRICIRNLRHKLGDDAVNPVWIFNERGVGYRMAEPGKE